VREETLALLQHPEVLQDAGGLVLLVSRFVAIIFEEAPDAVSRFYFGRE
jgi:hypothetical protein